MPTEPPGRAAGAPRVLIVDDEPSITFGLSHTLERRGFVVATAATAVEGRAVAPSFLPDLVLLDLRLPDEDGLVLLDEFLARSPAPRVIVMTGFALAETAQKARRKGAALVVQKPVDIDELLHVLAEMVGR
jgi:DNA-binding NtrC family response regulator